MSFWTDVSVSRLEAIEVSAQPRVQLDGNTDPCSNALGDTPEASFEECARTGVTAAQYGNILQNPSAQYNGLVGGNTQLDPEESDTYSFGFVLTPQFLAGFTVTVDYYDITVAKLINEGAVKQREDMTRLNTTLETQLKEKGLTFNPVDSKQFQQALREAGFYKEWKDKFGAEAWMVLERYAGPLA